MIIIVAALVKPSQFYFYGWNKKMFVESIKGLRLTFLKIMWKSIITVRQSCCLIYRITHNGLIYKKILNTVQTGSRISDSWQIYIMSQYTLSYCQILISACLTLTLFSSDVIWWRVSNTVMCLWFAEQIFLQLKWLSQKQQPKLELGGFYPTAGMTVPLLHHYALWKHHSHVTFSRDLLGAPSALP